jgi:hypothetical protein
MSDFTAFANSGAAGMVRARAALEETVAKALHAKPTKLKIADYPRSEYSSILQILREVGEYKKASLSGCYLVWAGDEDVRGLARRLAIIEEAITELGPLHRIILASEGRWEHILTEFDQRSGSRSFVIRGESGKKQTYVMPHKADYAEADAIFLEAFMNQPSPRSKRDDEPTMEIVLDDPNKTLPR